MLHVSKNLKVVTSYGLGGSASTLLYHTFILEPKQFKAPEFTT
jgi:hypothetical protein